MECPRNTRFGRDSNSLEFRFQDGCVSWAQHLDRRLRIYIKIDLGRVRETTVVSLDTSNSKSSAPKHPNTLKRKVRHAQLVDSSEPSTPKLYPP